MDMASPPHPPLVQDHPVLLLVFFHKALRSEISQLHRLALNASKTKCYSHELVLELRRRFEFLQLFYKYHCVAAEDEVIFLALDARVKNVCCTYKLEHRSMEGIFDSIFHWLNTSIEENEDILKSFQELVFCIGTVQATICHHTVKEEKQVLPLLVQHFSSKEQAALLWKFMCSVPVMILEKFLPWTISFLSADEQAEFMSCIRKIVPQEELLQEVVNSWLGEKKQNSSGAYTFNGKEAENSYKSLNTNIIFKLDISKHGCKDGHLKKPRHFETNAGDIPVDSLHLWHGAIRDELAEILRELCQIKTSKEFSNLAPVVVMLKFLIDVLVFYSNALEKFFNSVMKGQCDGLLLPFNKRFHLNFEGLQQLIHQNDQNRAPSCKFVEKLCRQLQSFLVEVTSQFTYQEEEVFSTISKTCSHDSLQHLLYESLHMMPLGLLKCVIFWFSACLSERESKILLYSIEQGGSFNRSFASLLYEWIRIGCSGKTSIGKFRKDLQGIFESKCSFLSEQIMEDSRYPSLLLEPEPSKGYNPVSRGTLYSSAINLRIFFPGTIEKLDPFATFTHERSCASSGPQEPRPVDVILFFHKALKKDLENLVLLSAKLDGSFGLLNDVLRRFHLTQFLYQVYSDAEDEIAFPALEKIEELQNISHSYSIDHKLEIGYFDAISAVLADIKELQHLICSHDSNELNHENLKYHQLCMKLHNMCKSLQSLLLGHVSLEEIELWPLYRECFTNEEQEKIIGYILGRTQADVLQDMIPRLTESLTEKEQEIMMSLWRKIAQKTMFDEWLGEWWDVHEKVKVEQNIPPLCPKDPLEIVTAYLARVLNKQEEATIGGENTAALQNDVLSADAELLGTCYEDDDIKDLTGDEVNNDCLECKMIFKETHEKKCNNETEATIPIYKLGELLQFQKSGQGTPLLTMSQQELEATIRRIYHDSSLDPQQKSYIAQNLLMSRWMVRQQISNAEATASSNEEFPGQTPSYEDPVKIIFGCKHYKRSCKLLAPCCNQLYTCMHCHDEVADHSLDRKSVKKMMCMKCLIIQPIGPTCSTPSCNNLSMARYYCKICKLFEDERVIYHCPYCNLCRLGRGLGIDYFHCMSCNACMSKSLSNHVCREKSLQDNCPICHEDMFTSRDPVKSLFCGHMMHSNCFQDYTIAHYTCPICCKTLGDMKVYFDMLDALLAEEKIPDDYSAKTRDILCHDCETKGTAPFHWLYHKCSKCGSYNTRVL